MLAYVLTGEFVQNWLKSKIYLDYKKCPGCIKCIHTIHLRHFIKLKTPRKKKETYEEEKQRKHRELLAILKSGGYEHPYDYLYNESEWD
jgi:hypothetical protein